MEACKAFYTTRIMKSFQFVAIGLSWHVSDLALMVGSVRPEIKMLLKSDAGERSLLREFVSLVLALAP
jgi:hypothetical protein